VPFEIKIFDSTPIINHIKKEKAASLLRQPHFYLLTIAKLVYAVGEK
jgi:hypothetical protein